VPVRVRAADLEVSTSLAVLLVRGLGADHEPRVPFGLRVHDVSQLVQHPGKVVSDSAFADHGKGLVAEGFDFMMHEFK